MNIEFIKKVKALADNGVGGEKTNAAELLKKLIEKYKISPAELENDTVRGNYPISFRGKHEKQIAVQCLAMVTDDARGYFKRNKLFAWCTKLQYVEIAALFEFYRHMFQQDLKTFVNAFIHKNNLFGKSSSNNERKELTKKEEEEINRMFEMMNGMTKHDYYKRLETATN